MIFKRRETRDVFTRARDAVSPRKGWRRGFEYIGRRVQRLPDTPHRIALGFACGAMASFTPFFTLHIVAAMAMAFALRGNLLASALGTIVGNPVTFPLIAASALACGGWITGAEVVAHFDVTEVFTDFSAFMDNIFLPYLVGGILPGLAAATACYFALRPLVAAYQARRRGKLMRAARARMRAHMGRRRPKTAAPLADPGE